MRPPVRIPVAALLLCAGALAAGGPRARAAGEPPGLMELTHITPPHQPPLAFLNDPALTAIKGDFEAASDRPRVLVLASGSCPLCLRGIDSLSTLLARDTTAVRVLVVWEHVTTHDHQAPSTEVLLRVPDRRAIQYWDAHRVLSDRIVLDLPHDLLPSVGEPDAAGVPLAWDCALVFRPGVHWDEHFPVPDWCGRPIADRIGALAGALHAAAVAGR